MTHHNMVHRISIGSGFFKRATNRGRTQILSGHIGQQTARLTIATLAPRPFTEWSSCPSDDDNICLLYTSDAADE